MAKILVTDDAAFMRMMLKDILVKQGHEVFEARSGVECIAEYQKVKPDLVTLDITMPEMDGLVAIRELMKIDFEAKVVMCSAMGQQAMVIEAIQSGAKDFIVKPFEAARVIESMNKALGIS